MVIFVRNPTQMVNLKVGSCHPIRDEIDWERWIRLLKYEPKLHKIPKQSTLCLDLSRPTIKQLVKWPQQFRINHVTCSKLRVRIPPKQPVRGLGGSGSYHADYSYEMCARKLTYPSVTWHPPTWELQSNKLTLFQLKLSRTINISTSAIETTVNKPPVKERWRTRQNEVMQIQKKGETFRTIFHGIWTGIQDKETVKKEIRIAIPKRSSYVFPK